MGKVKNILDVLWNKHPYFCTLYLILAIAKLLQFGFEVIMEGRPVMGAAAGLIFELLVMALLLALIMKFMGPRSTTDNEPPNDVSH